MSAKDEKSPSPQVVALINLLVAQPFNSSNAVRTISDVVLAHSSSHAESSLLDEFISSLTQLIQEDQKSSQEAQKSSQEAQKSSQEAQKSPQTDQPSALLDQVVAQCARLRSALHPSASDDCYQRALRAYHDAVGSGAEKAASNCLLQESIARLKALEGTGEAKLHETLFSKLGGAVSTVARRLQGCSSRSSGNRFLRAKKASSVFSQHAGLNHIPGAQLDKFGNSVGADADLGVDGAFEGLKVVVVHGYVNEGFDFSLPGKVLSQKGFQVQRFVSGTIPDEAGFEQALSDASQLWIISNSMAILPASHLDIVKDAWQQGMGLYIMGDNQPYYVDANRVIRHLFGPQAEMHGNLPGDQIAPLVDLDDPKEAIPTSSHFASHLLTTGISKLYTGITVATFKPEAAEFGFEPVLWESRGNPIVVYRDSRDGCGPVICDGAFTKLFYKFDHCGSDRFVRNCACWLSAITDRGDASLPEPEAPEQPDLPLPIDFAGALVGECDISFEEGPLALLVTQLADPLQNTSDFVIDNALGFARQNLVFGQQAYRYETAKMFLNQGQDPFRRVPVVAVVPLLDIRIPVNRALIEELLSHIFFGGRKMPKVVWSIFLSVCEHMVSSQPDHPEVWEFYIRQILAEVTSTPTFTDLGPQVPLLDAMSAFFHPATLPAYDPAPYRKILSHSGVKLRLLVHRGQMTVDVAHLIFRRLLVKTLLSFSLGFTKANPGAKALLSEKLLSRCFDIYHGIWLSSSEKLASFEDALSAFAGSSDQIRTILLEIERMEASLKRPVCLTPNDTTLLILLLKDLPSWSVSTEALLAHIVATPSGLAVWNRQPDAPSAMDALRQMYAPLPPIDPTHASTRFATGYGPSVWQCSCGIWFGDPNSDIDHAALKDARNHHFQQIYASDSRGYPTPTSQHFSGNRSIIQVLVSDQFRSLTSRQEANGEVERLVAQAILRSNMGNFHRPDIQSMIELMIDDFLAGRARGWPEPSSPSARIDFGARADLEKPDAIKRFSSSSSSSSS